MVGPSSCRARRASARLASRPSSPRSPTPTGAGSATCPAARGRTPRTSWPVTSQPPTLLVVDDFDAAPSPLPQGRRRHRRACGRDADPAAGHPSRGGGRVADPPRRAARDRRATTHARSARRGRGALDRDAVRRPGSRGAADPARSSTSPAACPPPSTGSPPRGPAATPLGASAPRPTGPRPGGGPCATPRTSSSATSRSSSRCGSAHGASPLDVPSDGVPASSASAITICPYKGLASFDAADAEYYFGRERLVAELVARSSAARSWGSSGASGSGKSSALRAGLLPALAAGVLPGSDRWPQAVVRPAEHPVVELGRALRRAFPDAPFAAEPSPRRPRRRARQPGAGPAAPRSPSTSSRRCSRRPATTRSGAPSSSC